MKSMTRTRALPNNFLFAPAMFFVTIFLAAVFCLPTAAHATPDKKDQQQGRLLYGKVLDQHDNPVPNAVVYLTNSRTHAVKTYIIGDDGTYRFPGLATVDYEVYAQYNGHKSGTRSVSQFDDRPQVYIDLRINTQ